MRGGSSSAENDGRTRQTTRGKMVEAADLAEVIGKDGTTWRSLPVRLQPRIPKMAIVTKFLKKSFFLTENPA